MEIETVPLHSDEFPPQISQVLERVAEQAEVHEPTLYYFAQELWGQFVMSIYGTGITASCWTGSIRSWIFGRGPCTRWCRRA